MKISKFKIAFNIAWKFLTGGREGVLDYALDTANTFADRLADAKKEDIKAYLATAKVILGLLDGLSRLCPKRWLNAYLLTLHAFADLVDALADLVLTKEELAAAVDFFRIAYAAWRAE